jgi:hypothetical protein
MAGHGEESHGAFEMGKILEGAEDGVRHAYHRVAAGVDLIEGDTEGASKEWDTANRYMDKAARDIAGDKTVDTIEDEYAAAGHAVHAGYNYATGDSAGAAQQWEQAKSRFHHLVDPDNAAAPSPEDANYAVDANYANDGYSGDNYLAYASSDTSYSAGSYTGDSYSDDSYGGDASSSDTYSADTYSADSYPDSYSGESCSADSYSDSYSADASSSDTSSADSYSDSYSSEGDNESAEY